MSFGCELPLIGANWCELPLIRMIETGWNSGALFLGRCQRRLSCWLRARVFGLSLTGPLGQRLSKATESGGAELQIADCKLEIADLGKAAIARAVTYRKKGCEAYLILLAESQRFSLTTLL